MKLLNDFFSIIQSTVTPLSIDVDIQLNAKHHIYNGHFPGKPITPGVIQMQIVDELLKVNIHKKMTLLYLTQCKFLNVLNPNVNASLHINIAIEKQEKEIVVRSIGCTKDTIFFKLIGRYRIPT
jgi:3-hydroxyacyl-[acyl-carrier-protein] dehydratase